MSAIIWFWPGVVVSALISLPLAVPAARFLRTTLALAWWLLFSVGVIIAATLTPINGPIDLDLSQVRPCDLSRTWLAAPGDLSEITDVSLNVAMFIPLGFAIAVLPRTRRTVLVLLMATALPFAVEGLQYLAPMLARGCQSSDVVDNLTGLVLGLSTGTVVRSIASWVGRARGGETA